jgi:hypothetical protein
VWQKTVNFLFHSSLVFFTLFAWSD